MPGQWIASSHGIMGYVVLFQAAYFLSPFFARYRCHAAGSTLMYEGRGIAGVSYAGKNAARRPRGVCGSDGLPSASMSCQMIF